MLSPSCEKPPNYYSCSYCSAPRTLNQTSLRCDRCKNWVHAQCVASIPLAASSSLVPFVMNYRFICKCCVKLRDRTKKRKGRTSKQAIKNDNSFPTSPMVSTPVQGDDHWNSPEHAELQTKENGDEFLGVGEGNNTWEMDKEEKEQDDGAETFVRVTAGWKEICITAFANLLIADHLQEHPNADLTFEGIRRQPIRPRFYNKKDHVVPFVDSNWRALCTDRTRTATWWATIGSCLYSAKDLFIVRDERARSANSEFGLVDGCLWDIGPGLIQSNSKVSQTTRSPKEQKIGVKSEPKSTPSTATSSAATSPSATKQIMTMSTPSPVLPPPLSSSCLPSTTCVKTERSPPSPISVPPRKPSPPAVTTKFIPPPPPSTRQTRTRSDRSKKPRSSSIITSSASPNNSSANHLSSMFPTTTSVTAAEHPFNRDGYRYTPCEPDPHLTDLAYRVREAPPSRVFGVHLPREDRSPALHVSKDGMSAMAEGGFRAARANCGVKEGNWYFEVFIDRGGEPKVCGYDGAHVRVGWARREASLLGPVGFDGYSYAYRDTTGDVVHCSRLSPYGASFGTGDVIGCYISLPQETPEQKQQPHRRPTLERRNRIPIRYKGQNYFESKEYAPTQQMTEIACAPSPPPTRPTFSFSSETSDVPTSSSETTTTPPSPPPRPSSRATTTSAHATPHIPPPPTLGPDSFIEFYKNGVPQGKAFTDIYDPIPRPVYDAPRPNVVGMPAVDDGTLGYYPAVSCYRGGRVTVNFGPTFKYPPPNFSATTTTNSNTTTTTTTSHRVTETNLKRPREENPVDEEDDDFSPLLPLTLPEPKRPRTTFSSSGTDLLDFVNRNPRPSRPIADRWTERMVEETVMDLVDELELFFEE